MKSIAILFSIAPLLLMGQAKDGFLRQQAFAEMQRVTGQVDVLQNNFDDLQRRVSRLESKNEGQGLRQEIEALRASVAELRRELQAQRGEIVKDLSGRIAKMQPKQAPAPKPVVIGPHTEYTVQKGDTLSLVSQAFNVPVPKIKEMNSLKSDNLRVGQKLMLPKQ